MYSTSFPIWYLISFIIIKEKKSSYIKSKKASIDPMSFFLPTTKT